MAVGLTALLDDIALIAKLASASLDDIGLAAGKAGAKAAGVVIDDAAVTPQYVTGFTPDRELPIIAKIARGSLRNKLLFILPAALVLSAFLPWAITPLLMLGGLYLCFEGAEKVIHAFGAKPKDIAADVAQLSSPDHEAKMVSGAVRTDFILSAEIMAIALNEVGNEGLMMQGAILLIVALVITIGVYGVVALIVKMDDIGLHMASGSNGASASVGRALVKAMPHLLKSLSVIGTAAMLWVGGGILLHGLEEFGIKDLPYFIHHGADVIGQASPVASDAIAWLVNAIGAASVGIAIGGVIALIYGRLAGSKH